MTPLELTWIWPDTLIIIGATIGVAVVAHIIVTTLIRRLTNRVRRLAGQAEGTLAHKAAAGRAGGKAAPPNRTVVRMTAMARLLRSVWTIALLVVVVLTLLSTLGVPLSPLLASAGIGGVMLAFGAQSLVKDYLSGIAMIVEDQYGLGDQITVGDISGTVEDISLRITKLRDSSGMIWYLRNGDIMRVGNVSQGYSTGLIDVPVAYDADLALVTEVLERVVAEVSAQDTIARVLLAPPELLGVESITATTMTLRIRIKTQPNQQYAPAREIREKAMAALAGAGVAPPAINLLD